MTNWTKREPRHRVRGKRCWLTPIPAGLVSCSLCCGLKVNSLGSTLIGCLSLSTQSCDPLLPTSTPISNKLTHHRCSRSRPQGRRQLNVSRNHDVYAVVGVTARATLLLWREPDVQVASTCSVMTRSLNVEHLEQLFLA